jgi:pSer/pThr/pTyr-binding forkhead associated (FHA) protein
MRARLFLLGDTPSPSPIVLDSYPVFLGIGDNAQLQISEYASAARRCQIHLEHGTLVAIDLDSPEGTWVNGECIERAPLLPGDKLHIGPRSMMVSYERLSRLPPPEVLYRSFAESPVPGEFSQ